MPYKLTFDGPPAGYSVSAAKKGEQARVSAFGFVSSEDGDMFVTFLEGFPNELLARGCVPILPSMVDHMLAIIRADKTATLYVNEVELLGRVQVKRPLKAGEPISGDDIADMDRLEFRGIEVPPDAGVVFLFSVGWRKALFYDLLPLRPKHGAPRDYDLEARLGQLFRYLQFQHVYKLDQDGWKALLGAAWFPFVALKTSTVKEMITHIQSGWDIDDLLPKIAEEVQGLLPRFRERWSSNAFFSTHYDVLKAGLERYEAGDYVSAISVLTPKVEGILRTFSLATGNTALQPHELTNSAVGRLQEQSPESLLFPRKFRKYLNSLYFRPFDAEAPEGMSRNTLAHGVAPAQTFTQKEALIIILVLDQLVFFLTGQEKISSHCEAQPTP